MGATELTRTEALIRAVRGRIANRTLAPGDRLPSIRQFASSMGVSPSTVVEAYARLEAAGIVRARRGSGFYVTGNDLPPMALSAPEAVRDRDIDPFWISRLSLDADRSVLMPGCGWLPADWMPIAAIRKGLRALGRAGSAALSEYGTTRGSLDLRRLLIGRFADQGISATTDQVLLTGSGTQAIDLVCRLLLRAGDVVLVDDPCYFNFHALLRAHQVRIVGVPFTQGGPDIVAFERGLRDDKPRLYITNSALHNPTGASMTSQTAHRLMAAAAAHGLTVVEDDIFADFEDKPLPRLAVLDNLDRVIKVGSFSKTLSASIRCGYIAASAEWIERLIDLQVATRFGGPSPAAAEVISGLLAGGRYRRHMDELRRRLIGARAEVADRLAGLGIVPWTMPRGGFYLWCRLPDGLDSGAVARACMRQGMLLAPGNAFSISQSAASFLRFNVAQMRDSRIYSILGNAMAEQAGR